MSPQTMDVNTVLQLLNSEKEMWEWLTEIHEDMDMLKMTTAKHDSHDAISNEMESLSKRMEGIEEKQEQLQAALSSGMSCITEMSRA